MNCKPMPKKQSIQLSECLELFTTNELLGEHDLWYCLALLITAVHTVPGKSRDLKFKFSRPGKS